MRAAVLNTAWNRWTTDRRFQRRGADTCRCVFGCPPDAEDSIEHYRHCPWVREAHRRHLKIVPPAGESLLPAWILGVGSSSKQQTARMALGAYATLRLYNQLKHGSPLQVRFMDGAFQQYLKEGALRHKNAEQALRTTWTTTTGRKRPWRGE